MAAIDLPTSAPARQPVARTWLSVGLAVMSLVIAVVGMSMSTAPSPAGSQSVPAAASAQVNEACLRVINGAQDVATILSEVGPAITAVNLQQLDDIVRRLQSIQTRLDDDLRDCKVEAQVNRTPTPMPSPLSTVEPSASATPLPTASPTG